MLQRSGRRLIRIGMGKILEREHMSSDLLD